MTHGSSLAVEMAVVVMGSEKIANSQRGPPWLAKALETGVCLRQHM